MLHKIKLKRLIAFVLVFCLMGTTFLTRIPMRVAEAADDPSRMPKTTHTFSNFGVEGQYTSNTIGHQLDGDITKLLDGGMLTEIIKVTGNYTMILFANSADTWEGLQVNIVSDNVLRFNIGGNHLYDNAKEFYLDVYSTEVGLTSFIGTEFELGLAFEKADTDNNGSNDLLMRIYINGKQCTATNVAWTAFVDGIYTIPGGYDKIVNSTDGANQFLNIYKNAGTAVFKETFTTTHNFESFGVMNNIYSENSSGNKFGGDITELLDGGMLSEKITINSRGAENYFMALFSDADDSWAGLQMQITAAGKLQMGVSDHLYDTSKEFYLHIEPSEVGLTSFIGTEFELGLAFEKADTDNNGSYDLLIRIYINGKRCIQTDAAWTAYQNGIYTIPGGYDKIINGQDGANQFFNIYPQGGEAKFEGVEVPSKLPTISIETSDAKDYKLISLNDLGIVDGAGKSVVGYYGDSFHETILGMQVTFNTSGGRLHFGTSRDVKGYSGVAIRLESNGTLRVENEIGANGLQFTGFDIEPVKTHLGAATFKGNPFTLHISTEIGEFGGAADKDDIKLGIFINEYLYNDQYLYIYDQADVFTDNLNFNEKTDTVWASVPTEPKPLPTDFTNITLIDAGIRNGNGNIYGEFYTLESMDKTLFSAKMKFSKNSSRLHFGMSNAVDGKFVGVGIRLDGTNLVVENEVGDQEGALTNLPSRTIEPQVAGVGDTFVDQQFRLQISTEFVDRNGEGGNNDVKLGIFINGTLYLNSYIYILDQAELFGTRININEGGAEFESYGKPAGNENIPTKLPTISIQTSDAKDFKLISLNELGIPDGTGKTIDGSYGESLHKTILGMRVTFNTVGGRLHFGYNPEISSYSGVAVRLQENGTLRVENEFGSNGLQFTGFDIEPAWTHLGASTFKGNTFTMHLSTEIGEFGGETGKDDIKLGIFINGYLYNDQYLYIYDQADVFTDNLNFNEKTDTEWSSVQTLKKPLPTTFTNITLSDAGIGNGSGNVYGEFLTLKSMNKTLFSAKIKFSNNLSRLHYGMCNDADSKFVGVGIRLEGNSLVVANELGDYDGALTNLKTREIDPQVAGIGETFVNKEFLLQISTEFVDRNGQGGTNDVKLGIFINGNLYLNSYIYILDQAELFGTKININEGGADFASYEKQYTVLTPNDFGVKNGSYDGNDYYKYDGKSLDQTIVNAVVRFSKNGTSSFGLGSEGTGISFEPTKEGNLKLNYVDASKKAKTIAVLTVKTAGVKLVDNDIRLRVVFDMANSKDDVTDLKLGVYINGSLYDYQYLAIKNVETKALKRGITLKANSANIKVASPEYVETTARDYSIPNTTYTNREVYGYYDGKTMDQTAFTAILKFSKEKAGSNAVYIGGKKWTGLRVHLGADGNLAFNHLHMDGHQSLVAVVSPQEVGMNTFFDTNFELRVTFDVLKEDATYTNYHLGIYINGQMVDNDYAKVKYVEEETLSRNLFIYTPKDGSVTITSVNNEVDFSVWGLDKSWKKTLGIK